MHDLNLSARILNPNLTNLLMVQLPCFASFLDKLVFRASGNSRGQFLSRGIRARQDTLPKTFPLWACTHMQTRPIFHCCPQQSVSENEVPLRFHGLLQLVMEGNHQIKELLGSLLQLVIARWRKTTDNHKIPYMLQTLMSYVEFNYN